MLFSFFMFFNTSCHVPCYTVFVSHFSPFSGFLPYSKSYSVHFSYSTFVSVSCHLPGNTLFVTHFSSILGFLATFKVEKCAFSIFHVFFQFPRHITCPKVCIIIFQCFLPYFRSYCVHLSFSTFFTFFLPYSLIRQCGLIIFLVFLFSRHILGPTVCIFHFSRFKCFWPYSRSYSVCVSFSTLFNFLAIFRSYS